MRPERQVRAVQAGLLALLALLALHLWNAEAPWRTAAWQRVQIGARVAPPDAVPFLWFASLANAGLGLVLLATARRWVPGDAAKPEPPLPPAAPTGAAFRAGVLGAVAVCALLAFPRLDQSLWGDEAMSASRSIHGHYARRADGTLRFKRIDWEETLWHYRQVNNHVFFSVLARPSTRAYEALARPDTPLRIEPGLRAPAFAAGLGAVAALALLLRKLGFATGGVLAAWLLALHPWHVRYASEARGYALLLLLAPLHLTACLAALRSGTWARWAAVGALQVLTMWTLPVAVFWLLPVHAWLLLELWRSRARGGLVRWLVTACASAGLWIELMAPNLVQLPGYLATGLRRPMDAAWWRGFAGHLLLGVPWGGAEPGPHPSLAQLAHGHPFALAAAVAGISALAAFGVLRLVRGADARARLVTVLLLYAPLAWAACALAGTRLFPRFLVLALPALLVPVGAGGEALAAVLRARGAPRGLAALLVLALLAPWVVLGETPRAALRARSLAPEREAVLVARPHLDPTDPRNAHVVTLAPYDWSGFYDPLGFEVRSVEDFQARLAEARRRGQEVFVIWDKDRLARRHRAEVMALVDRPDLFEPVADLPGFQRAWTRHVRRWIGPASGIPPRRAGP
jgi:hypothetical protein